MLTPTSKGEKCPSSDPKISSGGRYFWQNSANQKVENGEQSRVTDSILY